MPDYMFLLESRLLPEQRAAFAIDNQATLGVHLAMRDGAEGSGEHREDKPEHADSEHHFDQGESVRS